MSRRLVLAVLTGTLVTGGLAVPALAGTTSVAADHAFCITTGSDGSGLVAPGYCIWWSGAANPVAR